MKNLITLFGILLLVISSHAQPVGYNYGKDIEIYSTEISGATDLIDFTILVSITDIDLKSVANGGHVESDLGHDIIFTADDCSIMLDHQLESYDPLTGELVAWVRIPALSPVFDTNIHLYYGNSEIVSDLSTSDTWDSSYEGIWHMNNDPSTETLLDYSGNDRHECRSDQERSRL